jgi:signal transduction histidine kinase
MEQFNPNDFLTPLITGTIVVVVLTIFIIYFVIIHHKVLQKFNWERQNFEQELLQTKIEIRDSTLDLVASELHDNIGQIAALLKINLSMLSKNLEGENQTNVEDAITLTRQMITDIKSLSFNIKGEKRDTIDLIKSITNDVERINKIGYLSLNFSCDSVLPMLKQEVEIFLYRMAQEILNNILQHSQATEAFINIISQKEEVELIFSDNGKGFEPESLNLLPSGQKRFGIANLRKRCEILGATFNIESKINSGTTISITFNSLQINEVSLS